MSQKKRNSEHQNKKKSVPTQTSNHTSFPPFRSRAFSQKQPLVQKHFYAAFLFFAILTLALAIQSGINADDEYQNDYSQKLVNYYSSFGADKAALFIEKGRMHLYGGFFDVATGLVNAAFGLEPSDWTYHQIRHLFNAIFGLLAILFTGLLAKEIAGWRAGILAMLFLFVSPRFIGHTLMNPKDIPFAAGFSIALYFMVLFFKNQPKVSRKILVGMILGIALATATRIGGVLLIYYLIVFGFIYLWLQKRNKPHKTHNLKGAQHTTPKGQAHNTQPNYQQLVKNILLVSLASFSLALLFWPYGLSNPIAHTFEALSEFSKLGTRIRLLHGGENIMSDATSWIYPISWLWKTIPVFALIGILGCLIMFKRILTIYSPLPLIICLFAFLFPLIYVLISNAILHDGWRHLIFIYPPMIVLAAVYWVYLERVIESSKIKAVLYGIMGLMVLEPAYFIFQNHLYPYIYSNPLSGGVKNAFGHFETDYWGLSIKKGVEWLEQEKKISPEMPDTVTIASTFYYPLKVLLGKKYGGKVKVIYTPFNQRYEKNWDYGLFPSRFIKAPHLQNGTWPNSKAMVIFNSGSTAILAIEDGSDKTIFEAEKAYLAEDYKKAISLYERELNHHPDNELAWLKKANAHSNLEQFSEVIKAADKALEVAPENTNAWFQKAFANLELGNQEEAFVQFRKTTEINPKFAPGYYQMALLLLSFNDPKSAYENTMDAIKAAPNFKPAYRLAASILESRGETERAQKFLRALERMNNE